MRALGAIGATLATGASIAQSSDAGWGSQVTIYGWAAGVGGDITPFSGAPTLSFGKSFSDILKDLDGALFVTGLTRRDRLVVFGDLSYSATSKGGLVPPGIPASGKLTQRSLTLAAGYRVIEGPDLSVDLLAGLRAWKVKGSVSVPLAGVSASPERNFADPVVALRFNTALSTRWSAIGYLDVGGFGAGSDFTAQIAATANYQATDNVYLSAGYRHLYVDYRKGGTAFDGSMSGPIVGVTWRF